MLIYAVDDEPLLLDTLCGALKAALPDAEISAFLRATPALTQMQAQGEYPAVAFLDIELPGIGGMELAKQIKAWSKEPKIVFVTGFSHYAAGAYSIHAEGYVVKPVTKEKIASELAHLFPPRSAGQMRVRIQCFGNFEAFANGQPVRFSRSKAKELFAYLVHRRGAVCTTKEMAAVLFEDTPYDKRQLAYFQKIVQSMIAALSGVGAGDVLQKKYNGISVDVSKLDCDLYRFEAMEQDAIRAWHGEYMSQYSWAEYTAGALERSNRD